jgi:hypothetical protein
MGHRPGHGDLNPYVHASHPAPIRIYGTIPELFSWDNQLHRLSRLERATEGETVTNLVGIPETISDSNVAVVFSYLPLSFH